MKVLYKRNIRPNRNVTFNVPALRFPEFSGEWEQCQIKDFGKVITGSTPPTSKTEYYDNGEFLWASPADLGNVKDVVSTKTKLSQQGFDKCRKIPAHSILVTCIGSTIGKMGMATTEMATNQQINSIIPIDCSPDYVYYSIQSRFPKYITSIATQAVPILSKSVFESLYSYKTSIEEQNKIGKLLHLLDERIDAQSKIIEEQETLLKSLRESLLKQCSKSSVSCKIGDILTIRSGKDYQHLENGDIPVYGTGGLMCHVNNFLHDGESVCIGRKGTINKPLYLNGKFWPVDTLFYTHSFKGVLPRYCYHLFCTIDWLTYNEASGVPSLSKSTIEKISVVIPSIKIQESTVQALDSVEQKIDIDRNVLLGYQQQKEYLLSRMFI